MFSLKQKEARTEKYTPVRAFNLYKSFMIWKNLTLYIGIVGLRTEESNRKDEYYGNKVHCISEVLML